MKTNRLTARVLAVFAAVLLITAISIPAFAATSYVVNGNDASSSSVMIPEGKYNLFYSLNVDDVSIESYSEVPVNIVYAPGSSGDLNWDLGCLLSVPVSVIEGGFTQSLSADLLIVLDGALSRFFLFVGGNSMMMDGATLRFESVYESPRLTDYIPADTLPNVFNEIVALLPIALGVLIGYIAIRKGLSYLQSFLHNS